MLSADVASSLEQAMGRVLGSLCVLSSKDEDAESGMLASWISQVKRRQIVIGTHGHPSVMS